MKQKVFNILLDQKDYISGEKISQELGVSRTAIWKQINALREEGYEIDSLSKRGYLLKKRPNKLLATEIISGLELKHWNPNNVYTYEQVDSTNTIAKKMASQGQEEGSFIIAEEQLKGKGRMGREWLSPQGKGIWISFILRPDILPMQASQITFVVVAGILQGIKKYTGAQVKIKWPNDLLLNRKKITGILTEISAEIERINYIIAGVGINVGQEPEDFPPEIRERASSLEAETGEEINHNKLVQTIISEMEKVYFLYKEEGFEEILKIWRENNITLGRRVRAITMDGQIKGLAENIDQEGFLIIKEDSGEVHKIMAGDVSLRNEDGSYI